MITRMKLVKTKNMYGSQSRNKLVILEEEKSKQQNEDVPAYFNKFRAIKKLPVKIILRNNMKRYQAILLGRQLNKHRK